jgi:LysM domain-containing protein
MSKASWICKTGLLPALLLVALALPGWSEDQTQKNSAAGAASAEDHPEAAANDDAQKPAAAPPPAATPTPTAPTAAATPAPAAAIQTPPESPTPPTHLHKVGDHWTPYEPPDPESFPEGATVHIIVSGDNLWNLANTHFQNPYLWPQIWNENRYILDSHWIYPGDPLILPPRPTVVSEIVPATGQTAPPLPPGPESQEENPPAPAQPDEVAQEAVPETSERDMVTDSAQAVSEGDIYCTGEIRHDYKKTDLYIANEEQEEKVGLTEGDVVYLNGGHDGNKVQPGEEFQIIVKDEEVFHPVTDRWLGTYVRRAGRLKVLAVQENTSIAQITQTCGNRIEVGFELEPIQQFAVPEYHETPLDRLDVEPSGKANGYVVRVQDGRNQATTGNVVDVDLGSKDGLKPGDMLQVYFRSTPPVDRRVKYRYKWGNRRYESQELRDDDANLLFPRKPVGQLLILTTGEKTSTAKVMYTVREIEVGTAVEIR